MTKSMLSVAAAGAALAALCGLSIAVPPGFCAKCARAAVREVDVNMSIPGCFRSFDPRWRWDYGIHYGWYLGAEIFASDAFAVTQCEGPSSGNDGAVSYAMTASKKTGLPCAACHATDPGTKRSPSSLIELTPLGKAYQANGHKLPKDYEKYLE